MDRINPDLQLYHELFSLISMQACIEYDPRFREFSLKIEGGGSSRITMAHCPITGKKLPTSKRDEWFDAVEMFEKNIQDDPIPERYNSHLWWIEEFDISHTSSLN